MKLEIKIQYLLKTFWRIDSGFQGLTQKIETEDRDMDALTATKHELITFLQEQKFEHLSQREQVRLRDYFNQILTTLQGAADRQRIRQAVRQN